jgi:ribonuclease BN (tRNA processing enzyme)
MFTNDELIQKKSWGHSSIEQAIDFFEAANVSKVLISHHDPSRTDVQLDNLARSLPKGVDFAKDGMSVSI